MNTETLLQSAEDREALETLTRDHEGLFTMQALLHNMPMGRFSQCIGLSSASPLIREKVLQDAQFGESTRSQLKFLSIASGMPESRCDVLRGSLDLSILLL